MRHVTLIVRLVMDRRGALVHGEIRDAAGELQGRFSGRGGLIRALRAWLARQERREA